jgi:hypothetical protein
MKLHRWSAVALAVVVLAPAGASAQAGSPTARQAAISKTFYFSMDNAAIALDDAIGRATHGFGNASELARLKKKIVKLNSDRILKTGKISKGANLIQSAATEAVEGVRRRDAHALVLARKYLQQGRSHLASELR